MAVIIDENKYAVKVEYKPEFDTSGNLDLPAYSQTFARVKENGITNDQLKAFADGLMSLTVYRDAPYKVSLINTGELVVE